MKEKKAKLVIAPTVALVFSWLMLTDRSGLVSVTLLAALLHECGHILAAKALKIPFRKMRVDFMGARLEIGGRMLSYREEWLLAAAGPIASLAFAALGGLLWQDSPLAVYFSCASLLLGLLNLLPIRSFDGGRMLEGALLAFLEERSVRRVLTVSSFLFLFLLWSISVYFLLRVGDGISLFFFSVSLFSRFFGNGGL